MAITNGYCTLAEIKAHLRVPDSIDDELLELAVTSASRAIDVHCGRRFYSDGSATARVFVADSGVFCPIDDIASTSGLVVKTDTDADGTFGTTWASTDYQLEPLNGRLRSEQWAYTGLRAVGDYYFPTAGGEALVEVTADWGWPAVPTAVKHACIMQAIRFFNVEQAPMGVMGFAEIGEARAPRLAPDVRVLLDGYRTGRALGMGVA